MLSVSREPLFREALLKESITIKRTIIMVEIAHPGTNQTRIPHLQLNIELAVN
jgi:hypothetical protein